MQPAGQRNLAGVIDVEEVEIIPRNSVKVVNFTQNGSITCRSGEWYNFRLVVVLCLKVGRFAAEDFCGREMKYSL